MKEVLQYNQNIIDAISDLRILSNITIKKKPRHPKLLRSNVTHFRRNGTSCMSLQNKIDNHEIRIDVLEDDIIGFMWEIGDIKKILSEYKSKNKNNTSSDSSGSD